MKKESQKATKVFLVHAFEFLSESCKWLTLKNTNGRWSFHRWQWVPLPKGETHSLREWSTTAKHRETASSAVLIIPRTEVVFRELKIPSTDPVELRQMVNLQIENLTAQLTKEEMIYSYLAYPADAGRTSVVSLYWVKREWVRERVHLLQGIGFKVSDIFLSSEVLSKLITEWLKPSEQTEVIGVIDIDSTSTEWVVLKSGEILFSRGIHAGAHELEQKKITLEQFCKDLFFTLAAYQRGRRGPAIERLVITGVSGEWIAELRQRVGNHFSTTVQSVGLGELLKVGPIGEEIEKIPSHQASLVSVIAGILHQKEFQMDFFPQEIRQEEQHRQFKKGLVVSAILATVLLALWGLIVAIWVGEKRYIIHQLTEKAEQIRPAARELEEKKRRLTVVKEATVKKQMPLDLLQVLYEKAPKEVSLVALDYSGAPFKVDFEGVSKSLSSVFAYVNNLRDAGMLKEVNLKYANKKKAKEGQVIEFRITAMVVPEGLYVEE